MFYLLCVINLSSDLYSLVSRASERLWVWIQVTPQCLKYLVLRLVPTKILITHYKIIILTDISGVFPGVSDTFPLSKFCSKTIIPPPLYLIIKQSIRNFVIRCNISHFVSIWTITINIWIRNCSYYIFWSIIWISRNVYFLVH